MLQSIEYIAGVLMVEQHVNVETAAGSPTYRISVLRVVAACIPTKML